jgi:1,5-anhydro-D-fructose reductase (1,5-anhydro-D-mannitol-forming)
MALTVEECRLMVEACQRHQVRLGVGFHLRHHPGHQRLRELVQGGALGTVILAHAQWAYGTRGLERPRPRAPLQQWWEDPALVGAGAWMGSGVHCVDLLRYVLGQEVVEVAAVTDASEAEPLENLATVLLRFQNGSLGTAIASRRLPDSRNDLVVYGSGGRGEVRDSLQVDLQGALEVTSAALNTTERYPLDPLALYVRQVEAFNDAVASSAEPAASGWDGLKVAEVTIAMLESARTGRRVRLG